jgi:folate-dependent phosphoribosylglycinamide formyltransferase PurN
MENKKIVLLAVIGESTNIIYNSISKYFGIFTTIIESKESTKTFIKRRIKRLGLFTVIGQILFQIFIAIPLNFLSKKRKQEIINDNLLDVTDIPKEKINAVTSVNSSSTISLLKDINPDIIIVNGTRIISKKILSAINCKFINTHAGITPKYRGLHGTYWALLNNDLANSGVTVHFVDEGIDTGDIINQSAVVPSKNDNFSTYPLLQLSEGLKILNIAIQDFFDNKLITQKKKSTESKLWYHPTIWTYLFYRIFKGVK